jgi:triacylglycerol lipase
MNPPIPNQYDAENAANLVQFASDAYVDGRATLRGAVIGSSQGSTESHPTMIENEATDTRVVVWQTAQDLIIAFRGTADMRNWLTDLDCRFAIEDGCRVHAGFAAALESVFEQLKNCLSSSMAAGKRLWLTGHSLGGALALLFGWRLMNLRRANFVAGIYTFGQPRVGNAAFRDSWPFQAGLNGCTYRVIDEDDIVPSLPWLLGDYRHAGHEVFYPATLPSLPVLDRPFWTRIPNDISGCARELRHGKLALLADHHISRYIGLLSCVEQASGLSHPASGRMASGGTPAATGGTPVPPNFSLS